MDTQTDQTAMAGAVVERFRTAEARKREWAPLWQDCYDMALPQRGSFTSSFAAGQGKTDHIYDATALDAVDQLAASMLGNLTPIWSQWFGLKPGPDLSAEEADKLSPVLEAAAKTVQDHFDRSNFAMEIHQCYLDLIVGGTASLHFDEAETGAFSAFNFKAVALKDVTLNAHRGDGLGETYRALNLPVAALSKRYPDVMVAAIMPYAPDATVKILEAVVPSQLGHDVYAILMEDESQPELIYQGRYEHSPYINFRWQKSPGEIYGRSPVMKALPDIKTANKVVELVLKNASIAVTGIWQADDDGVLNPSNIQLTPGSIIPKAMGSKGLQPLDMPGRFDVSQLVLESLQSRIRHALLTDRLGPVTGARMTATEIMERSAEMAMLLGATYGRLQAELLTPLIKRAFAILRRRGEVPDIALDGRYVVVDYRSPLARSQGQRNVQNTLSWVNSVLAMGGDAATAVDLPQTARFLGDALGVPSDLIRKKDVDLAEEIEKAAPAIEAGLQALSGTAPAVSNMPESAGGA